MTPVTLSAQSLAHSRCSILSIIITNLEQHFQGGKAGTSYSGWGYCVGQVKSDSSFSRSFHFAFSSFFCHHPRRVSEVVLLKPASQAQLYHPVGCLPLTVRGD